MTNASLLNKLKLSEEERCTCMLCKSCGKVISIEAEKCPNCGDQDPFSFHHLVRKAKKIRFWTNVGSIVTFVFTLSIINKFKWWHFIILLLEVFIWSGVVAPGLFFDKKFEEICNHRSKLDSSYGFWQDLVGRIEKKYNNKW